MKKFDFLTGTRVLEEVDSMVNGKVRVLQSLAWGNYIQAGDKPSTLTQSGGVLLDVWKYTLKKLKKEKSQEPEKSLILGLGGGSAAKLIKKFWPKSKIVGVEIDPVMVELGMKYLGLSAMDVDIKTKDAMEFCVKESGKNKKYDLTLVDIYVGDKIPEKFETEEFIDSVKQLMDKNSITVFNRLYYDEKRLEASRFGKKLEDYFESVEAVYPAANVMYICSM